MSDYLIRGKLADVDPAVAELIQHEHARQFAKIIMIASESTAPSAIREAESSVFRNIYAEGYPLEAMRTQTEDEILDYETQLAVYRRNGDRRYYKGVEYCNMIEALAQRRGAEVFCPAGMTPDQLYVNVQPLSGAVANTSVYEALLQPGEKVLALDLRHGGHLSHGSPVNITGRRQQIINYHVNDETELLDYEEIYETAMREKPKMMIAGYTSYPWAPDFKRFREIADACGSILLADISHTAGMAAVGAYPNSVGIAHVTTFTTHKTLMGPRGAVIITTDPELAKKIDRAVFPGMQGGPFMHKVAATATMFKIAQTPQFRELQFQTAKNAVALSEGFKANGLRVVHGGTNTHMVLLDCKSAAKNGDVPLMGDTSSRILELANIVCNRNTIPGDPDAGKPSALRFGTPWVTQRGLREDDMREIAATVALVLKSAKPYAVQLKKSVAYRARVDFDALIEGARRMSQLAQKAGVDVSVPTDGYPHMWEKVSTVKSEWQALEIAGHEATNFLNAVLAEGVADLGEGERKQTQLLGRNRVPLCEATVINTGTQFVLGVPSAHYERAAQWLRALSDGFVIFDDADVTHGVPGPVTVTEFGAFKA